MDIVIGTHKLTSKEVKFKDLGLLIIDEEQKFGVAVKEKLRQFKVNVDTLTMTASCTGDTACVAGDTQRGRAFAAQVIFRDGV